MRLPRKITALAVAAILAAGCAATGGNVPEGSGEPGLSAEERMLNVESFDVVWNTVNERFYDPGFEGRDWVAIGKLYRPRIEAAGTLDQARLHLNDMVGELGVSHMGIIPSFLYGPERTAEGNNSGSATTGIETRFVEGMVLVVSVEEDSPADSLGVMTGWEILEIEGEDIKERMTFADSDIGENLKKEAILAGAVSWRLAGEPGGKKKILFRDGKDRDVSLEIPLAEGKGRVFRLGHLPPSRVRFEKRRIGEDTGYIAFNCFTDPVYVMPGYNEAMREFMDCRGIVIDLRGNPGGIGAMVIGMAGWLVEEKNIDLGTLSMRQSEMRLIVNPRPLVYGGKVAILVDGLSGSASEFMAGGLQGIGRARVFGSRTVGMALLSEVTILPNGDRFQYVTGNFASTGGRKLEGVGVVPDHELTPAREALLEGRDVVLEAAAEWIKTK